MSRKLKFKKVPQTLQGKVIAITGVLPGAGKSFSKKQAVSTLRNSGYRVRSLGTTQIASDDQTLCSYLRLYDVKEGVFKKYSDNRKLHTKTSAFIFIDEAWMSNQQLIDMLQEDFPYCCFILVGDPSQLEGAEQDVDQIWKVDRNIILEGSHRSSDERLIKFLNELREGTINFDLLKNNIRDPKDDLFITFLKSERDNYNEICAKNATLQEGGIVYSLKGIMDGNTMRFFKADKEWTDSWKNMQLWRITKFDLYSGVSLESITGPETIANLDLSIYMRYFHNASSVNINKIQGATLKDTNISIRVNTDQKYIKVLRELYVMCSRVASFDQISIAKEFYDDLYQKFHKHISAPLSFSLNCQSSIKVNSSDFKNISEDKLIQYLDESFTDPVALGASCYIISRNAPKATGYTFDGLKLTGRGHKVEGITRGTRERIVRNIKKGTLDNNALNEIERAYVDKYIELHPEYATKLNMKYTEELYNKYHMPVCKDKYSTPTLPSKEPNAEFIVTAEYTEEANEKQLFDRKGEHMRPVCFVYESDDLPKEEQLKIAMNLPKSYILSITDSGSKSIHTLVLIDEKWRDVAKEHFKLAWTLVGQKLFGENAKYLDKACASVARLSRMPGGIRENGKEQTCYFLNRRPIGICLDEFVHEFNKVEEEKAYRQKQFERKTKTEITDVERAFRNICLNRNSESSLLALEIYESGIAEKGSEMFSAVFYTKNLAKSHNEFYKIAKRIYDICHSQHPTNIRKRFEDI